MLALFIIEGLAALLAIVLIGRYGRQAPVLALVVVGALGIGFSVTWASVALLDRHPPAAGDVQTAPEWSRFIAR